MASLDVILRDTRRRTTSNPYGTSYAPQSGVGGYTPTRSSSPQALSRKAPEPYNPSKDPQVINLSEAVTDVVLPDGSMAPAQAPSGAPYLIRKPGSRSTFLDPQSGNTLAPDPSSPTGIRDVTAAQEEAKAARATERSRVEQARTYAKVQKEMAKEKEEQVRQQNAAKTNEYLAQGRKYFLDRVTGEPVPLQTDEEFARETSEKAKKAAEASRAKAINNQLKSLDVEADELRLNDKPPTETEYQKIKEESDKLAEFVRGSGFSTDDQGLSDFGMADPLNAEMVNQYKTKRDQLRKAEDTRLKLENIERRKLDLRKQALDPEGWKAEKEAVIQGAADADIDRELSENQALISDLEQKAQEEASPLLARDKELVDAHNKALERYNAATTGADKIRLQREVDGARARVQAWEAESAEARASVNETYKALNDRIELGNKATEMRNNRIRQDKQQVYAEIQKSPFLKPFGDRLQAIDADEAVRMADLAEMHPEGIPEAAQQALAQDITNQRQQAQQELYWANQTKQANLNGLYQKYGANTRSENWLTENDPQLAGMMANIAQDARQMGVTEQEVREAMERNAALDWSNPRRVDKMGRADFSEDFRMLPDGAVTINPRHYLDEAEYNKAVESSPASPEEKKLALAMRRDLAAPLAAVALQELEKDVQLGQWIEDNTKGTPLERMEQFNAELKKGGALSASYHAFRGGAGSLAASMLGGIAAATDSEGAMLAGQYFNQHAQAYQMAADAAGKGTGPLGRFLSKVSGAVPSVAPGIAVGLLTGGLGAPQSIALTANALAAAFQSTGGTYLEAYNSLPDTLSHTEKRAKVLAPAIASGLATGLITAAGGARGAESVLSQVSQETLKTGVKAAIGRVLTNLSEEAIEELSDQLAQGIIARGTYAKDKDLRVLLTEAIEAGLVGAVIGGGLSAAREVKLRAPAQPIAAPTVEPTPDLPEQQALVQDAIAKFVPTPELLPPAVAEVAQITGADKAAQNAAQALVAIAKGADLASLPAAQLEAIGYTKTDKGAEPRKGAQPLVYSQDGQLVIRDEALQWLEAEEQPAIRDQIGLSEQERIAQIQAPVTENEETLPPIAPDGTANNAPASPAVPAVSPADQTVGEVGSEQAEPSAGTGQPPSGGEGVASSPSAAIPTSEQAADLADQEALAAAQEEERRAVEGTAFEPAPANLERPKNPSMPLEGAPPGLDPEREVPPTPQGSPAPPFRRRAIGKGMAGSPSFAEFDSDEDVMAFSYHSATKTGLRGGNKMGESQRAAKAKQAAENLATLSRELNIPEQELRGILPAYNKAVAAQGKATPEGEAFKAESIRDFIARTRPQAAAKPSTESPQQSTGKVSQEAAAALGVTPDGKLIKDGYTAKSNLKGQEAKRLQSASKAIVDTLSKAERIKGVTIKITNNESEPTAQLTPDGIILINPRKMAAAIAQRGRNDKRAPREIVVHELIHRIAGTRLSFREYAALWRNLTPEIQDASLRAYYQLGPTDPIPETPDSVAGAEFFAQVVEARLKGELTSQIWQNPEGATMLESMVRKFIQALRDLAGVVTDPDWKKIIEKQANQVEQDLRSALREAGIEQEFLGGEDAQALNAPKPGDINPAQELGDAPTEKSGGEAGIKKDLLSSEEPQALNAPEPNAPSPVEPANTRGNPATDAEVAKQQEQHLADLQAVEDLRNDPETMRALAESIEKAKAGTVPPDPRNRALGTTTPGARAVQQAALVAQTMNGLEVQDQGEVFQKAKDAIVKDRAAVEESLFNKVEDGEIFNTDDLAQAQLITEILQRESTLNPQDTALYTRLLKLTNHWADNKTATGRALSIMRDPQQTPLQRMRQSIAVVSAPPAQVRRQMQAAWTPRQKSAAIRKLEEQIKQANDAAQIKLLEANLETIKAQKDRDQIMAEYVELNKRQQADILKSMGLTQDDIMLNPEDRYGVIEAVLDTPAIKEKVAALPKSHQQAIRLAMMGYNDASIATRVGMKAENVPAVIENFRQNIMKPAVAADVKKGRGFSAFVRSGLAKITGSLKAPFSGTLPQAEDAGVVTAQNSQAIQDEVDRIVNYALQPAKWRNKAGAMNAKVVTLPNGQKVRMYLPFDPDDARGFYRYARELSTRESSAFDKIYEYWINGILSGVQTQVANVAGNAGQIAWNYTFQRAAEAFLNLAYRDKDSARLGEFPHVFRAFWKAMGPSLEQAKLAWTTEADNTRTEYLNEPLTVDFKDTAVDKVGGQKAAIGGKKGRIIRIPGRILRFVDAYFKTSILHAEATANAYREGKAAGYKGQALDAYMTTRLQDYGSSVWQKAMDTADELLFQSENWATKTASGFVRQSERIDTIKAKLEKAKAKGDQKEIEALQKNLAVANFVAGTMRFIFPFTRTPTNILRVGVRKSGGAAVSMLFNVANGLYQRKANGQPFLTSYSKASQVKDLSETALAALAWVTLAGMAEGDDDDDKKMILIIGNRPYGAAKQGEKEEVMRKYGGTQTIIFRNSQGQEVFRFAYGRYEPFATAFGVIVDTMREIKQARKSGESVDAAKMTGSIAAHLMAQAESKSFLQGLASVSRSVDELKQGQFKPGAAAGKFLVAGVVPNLVRQTMRNADDYQRDFKSAGWQHEALPGGWFAEPAIGPGGKPVEKGGNVASRLFFQAPNAPSMETPEQVFQQYNLRHPGQRIDRGPLKENQYYAYAPDGKTHVDLTTREDKRLFREVYEQTYARQVRRFMIENPQIRAANPPIEVVEKARDVNAAAMKETRNRFLLQKRMRETAQRAKTTQSNNP